MRGRRRKWVAGVALVTALGGAGALLCLRRGPPPPAPPELGADANVDAGIVTLIRTEGIPPVREDPYDAAAWEHLGRIYDASNFDDQAATCYEQSLRLEPAGTRAHFLFAFTLDRLGRYAECDEHLRRAAALDPESARIRRAMGELALRRGRLEEAEAHALEVDRLSPGDPGAALLRARVQLQRDENREAVETLLPLVVRRPPVLYGHHLLGEAYRALGEEQLARTHAALGRAQTVPWSEPWLHELETLRPSLRAQLEISYRESDAGDHLASIERLERLLPRHAGDVHLATALGHAYVATGRLDDAVALLTPVVERNPARVWPSLNLADAHLQAGRLDRAAVLLDAALEVDPDFSKAREVYGHLYMARGRTSKAIAAFEQAACDAPDDTGPLTSGGFVSLDSRRFASALDFFSRALELDPVHPESLGGRVLALHRLGRPDDAEAALREAEALPLDGFPAPRLHLLRAARRAVHRPR